MEAVRSVLILKRLRSNRKNRARKKITEARRVGGRRAHLASRAERGELTRFFEIRSNLFENVHQKGNRRCQGFRGLKWLVVTKYVYFIYWRSVDTWH